MRLVLLTFGSQILGSKNKFKVHMVNCHWVIIDNVLSLKVIIVIGSWVFGDRINLSFLFNTLKSTLGVVLYIIFHNRDHVNSSIILTLLYENMFFISDISYRYILGGLKAYKPSDVS